MMMKQPLQICLFWALSAAGISAICQTETCRDSIETLDAIILESITEELSRPSLLSFCTPEHAFQESSLLFYCLHEARCSAEYIYEVYTRYADLITPEQAKYIFSRSPQVSKLLDKLIFGLEYAKKALEESGNNTRALGQVNLALNKAKVTHCPHCYIKVIIPAIDNALAFAEENAATSQEDAYDVIL